MSYLYGILAPIAIKNPGMLLRPKYILCIGLALLLSLNQLAIAYDNPAGSVVDGGVSTSDASVTNEGQIGPSNGSNGIEANGVGAVITNSGIIVSYYGSINTNAANQIATNTQNGIIYAIPCCAGGVNINSTGDTFINDGLITTTIPNAIFPGVPYPSQGYSTGIYIGGSNANVTNSGIITLTGPSNIGVDVNASGGAIANSGTMNLLGANNIGVYIEAGKTLSSLINTGAITASGSGAFDIQTAASGHISMLSNSQGGDGSIPANTALTYSSNLPTNYSIIVNSSTSYGQLAVTSGSGSMTVSLAAGSAVNPNGKYVNVLTGLVGTLTGSTITGSGFSITGAAGSYSGHAYNLAADGSPSLGDWDLCFGLCNSTSNAPSTPDGPSTANTQQSLVNTAQALQGTYTLQNSVLANSFSYDCTEFGANGVCISAGGRNTAVSAANGLNNTSGLLIAAYRPHQNYRVGAYVDQNLSVNNAGSTVNLGNNTPLIGLFGAWSEHLDGTGTEVKVSAAYGQKNTTINRSVVGSGDTASEAGTGGSKLNSQGAQVTAKYGFGVIDNVVVSPYVGIRYTQNNMGGYTEATSAAVTAPLTYSALNTNATTALAGVGASYRGIPQTTLFASAGVETDTNTANGSYVGNNAYFAGGLTPVNFNANPVKTRPTASLGAYYDVVKNQRIGITGIFRQEAYQAVSTTTVMATYTVGL